MRTLRISVQGPESVNDRPDHSRMVYALQLEVAQTVGNF